jgi:hypothetical protein
MMSGDTELCLRQGYQCSCSQCKIWIARWSKELDAFTGIDTKMKEGKNLFQIYEWLRAQHPDVLHVHHASIEAQYIEFKIENSDLPL